MTVPHVPAPEVSSRDLLDVRGRSVAHRTLVLGDSHGDRTMLREGLRLAAQLRCDQVVSVGDFGIWPGRNGRSFLDGVQRHADRLGVDVVVAAGNHDDYDQIAAAAVRDDGLRAVRDRVLVAPRGHVLLAGRFRWMFCGGAASIDGPGGMWGQNRGPLDSPAWMPSRSGGMRLRHAGEDLGGWWVQERITEDDVVRCEAAGSCDVLVTHDAPSSVPLKTDVSAEMWPAGHAQRLLLERVRDSAEPAVTLAGHWHRHVVHTDGLGTVVVLSADAVPDQVQWVLVDDDLDRDLPRLRRAAAWDRDVALTGDRPGAAVSYLAHHHQVGHLSETRLCDIPVRG